MKLRKKHKKESILLATDLFPQDARSQAILLERSVFFGKQLIQKRESENVTVYVKFKLSERESYGIPFSIVKEVLHKISITPVPCVPDYIAGVINRRGVLISIVNLDKFFHLHETENPVNPSIIILANNNRSLGFLVEDLEGSDGYIAAEIAESSAIGTVKAEYIVGIHKGVTTILRAEKIIDDIAEQFQTRIKN